MESSDQASVTSSSPRRRRPIRDDFFVGSLEDLASVRLRGSRCRACGEAFFGHRSACESCQSDALEAIALSRHGILWSYTVNRYRPPGDYKGPDPHQPFGVGWVELPEGLRILSPLRDCDVDALQVGMPLELVVAPLYMEEDGSEVVAYAFRPRREGG